LVAARRIWRTESYCGSAAKTLHVLSGRWKRKVSGEEVGLGKEDFAFRYEDQTTDRLARPTHTHTTYSGPTTGTILYRTSSIEYRTHWQNAHPGYFL